MNSFFNAKVNKQYQIIKNKIKFIMSNKKTASRLIAELIYMIVVIAFIIKIILEFLK